MSTSPLAVVAAALLRCFGADVVDCSQSVVEKPASLTEGEVEALRSIASCGIQHRDGRLWLFADTWRRLAFDRSGLVGLQTVGSSALPGWWPGGTDGTSFWVHRNGTVRRTHTYDNGPDDFQGGLTRYLDARGKFGFVDQSLRIAIPAAFDFAFPFDAAQAQVCNGCAQVGCEPADGDCHRSLEGGAWGKLDRSGRVRWGQAPGG